MRAIHRAPLVLAAALLAGCADATASKAPGDVDFTYDGAVNGRFAVRGTWPDDVETTERYATAFPGTEGVRLRVFAQRVAAREGAVRNYERFYAGFRTRVEPGTLTCAAAQGCPFEAWFTLFPADAPRESLYQAVAGRVTIASVDGGRVRGSFSLTMENPGAQPGTARVAAEGTFDVPLADR